VDQSLSSRSRARLITSRTLTEGRRAPAAAKAASLAAARSHPLTWRTVLNRAVIVAAAGADLIEQVADGLEDGIRAVDGHGAVPGVVELAVLAAG
jgi:hypothetical protein